jgi:hypothetical protein
MISTISSRARLWVAAAAVVVAVAIGATVVNRGNEQTGVAATVAGPTQGPSLAPALTPAPIRALGNAPSEPCPGDQTIQCVKQGTYLVGSTTLWPAVVTLDVPAGWWLLEPGTGMTALEIQRSDAGHTAGWGVTFSMVGSVSRDPCNSAAGTFPADVLTPSELAATMAAWPGFEATEPEPIRNGAYEGQRFTLVSTKRFADCGSHVMWTTPHSWPVDAGPLVNPQNTPHVTDFRIFEIDGELLVVIATDFPESSPTEEVYGVGPDPTRHAGDQVELAAILDSIQLSPPTQP